MLPIASPSHKINSEHLHRTCSTVKQVAALLLLVAGIPRTDMLQVKHLTLPPMHVAHLHMCACVCVCSEVVGVSGERVDKIARNFRKYSRVYYEPPAEIVYHSAP